MRTRNEVETDAALVSFSDEARDLAASGLETLAEELAERIFREAHALGRSEGYAEGVEAAAQAAIAWADHYPRDVFSEDGRGTDATSARMARLTCANVAKEIRALRAPSPEAQAAGARDTAPAEAATRPTPDAAPGAPEGGNYCTRCHMTEALHHVPNIYTGRKDARGNAYPPPCDEFMPAQSPKEDAPHGRCRCAERVVIPHGAEVVWVGTISHSRLYGCYERPVPYPKEDAPRDLTPCVVCGTLVHPDNARTHCEGRPGGTGRSTTGGGR